MSTWRRHTRMRRPLPQLLPAPQVLQRLATHLPEEQRTPAALQVCGV
jgi:hypothetical protein